MTVGIPGWLMGPNSFGIPLTYLEYLESDLHASEIRILTPYSPLYTDLDLLVLPGGADVNPMRYGERPSFNTDKPDLLTEYFDLHVLPEYVSEGIPIFGICRGCQTIAVHFGAKLIQHMTHETNSSEKPWEGMHNIRVTAEPNKKIKVNSRHHQAVYIPSLVSTPVELLATHSAYPGHLEALRVKGHRIAAVQYHPEDLNETSGIDYAMSLVKSILK
jgi:putative glutamine amidotransferase